MCGGVLFTSDNCADYSEQAKQVFTQALRLRDAKVTGAFTECGTIFVTYQLDGKEETLKLCR